MKNLETRCDMTDLTSVWVPYGMRYENDGDRPGWEAMEFDSDDPDFHWFATREACLAECERRNGKSAAAFRAQYDAYVSGIERRNGENDKARAVKIAEHEALVAAGLRKPTSFTPAKHEEPQTFDQWGRWRGQRPKWDPQELKRSESDHG